MDYSSGSVEAVARPFCGPWKGQNKLVLGIDVGVRQSEVAFTFLQTGENQVIHRVNKWPGQEVMNQQRKVPSLVWYDTNKRAVAFGAEALSPDIEMQAEDNNWSLAKHFKLNLHPDTKHDLKLEPLPPGVSLRQIYSDFLGYLLHNTQSYFEDRILDGKRIWQRYKPEVEIVIAHPNGWSSSERALLRSAAVTAGFTKEEAAPSKIHFVTECEALAHFFMYSYNLWSAIQVGLNLIVYHCENSKVHITSYTINSVLPAPILHESQHSTYDMAGMLFVDDALKRYIQDTLTEAGVSSEDLGRYTSQGITDFKLIRRSFSTNSIEMSRSLRLNLTNGGGRIHLPANGINRGTMCLPANRVESFFEPCVDEIKALIGPRTKDTHVSFVFCTGEIMDVPYLRHSFEQFCDPQGCQVLFADSGYAYANPGIADGVINWYIVDHANKHCVQRSFGFETSVPFDYNISEHRGRLVTLAPTGLKVIRGRWEEIAIQHIPPEKDATFKKPISMTFPTSRPEPSEFKLVLYSYSGGEAPCWMRDKQGRLLGGFREWVTISVNLVELQYASKPLAC